MLIRPPVHLALAAVLLGGVLYIIGQYVGSQPQRAQQDAEAKREISVQGQGEIEVKPEIAKVTVGLQTGPQPNAKAALDLLGRRFTEVVAAVRALGVKEEDVKTTNFSVHPVYDYTEGRQTLRGFEASEQVEVKVRNLEKAGEVLARATAAGANVVGDISFEVAEPNLLQTKAQEKAITDARAKADVLAKALGVRLGRVKTFSAGGEEPKGPVFTRALEAVGGEGPVAPPVPPGLYSVQATVSVTFELR